MHFTLEELPRKQANAEGAVVPAIVERVLKVGILRTVVGASFSGRRSVHAEGLVERKEDAPFQRLIIRTGGLFWRHCLE